jgi:tetratricopeptide repeat protein 8
VLTLEPSNIEAIASLGSHHFYNDQPEVALKFYRRLLQMGLQSTELWNNIGLCCFYASQYDMTLDCFQRALAAADDDNMADIWSVCPFSHRVGVNAGVGISAICVWGNRYNVGQVAIGIGDLGLAYQAFKISVSINSNHAESFCNLGVLELRKGNIDQARSNFVSAQQIAPFMFESFFNGGDELPSTFCKPLRSLRTGCLVWQVCSRTSWATSKRVLNKFPSLWLRSLVTATPTSCTNNFATTLPCCDVGRLHV